MDLNSIIAIVIGVVVIFFFVKLVINPLVKAILGIAIFLIAIYLLQKFFHFNLDNVFGPFSAYFLKQINYYGDKAAAFFHFNNQTIKK